jgi:hypothetical protein
MFFYFLYLLIRAHTPSPKGGNSAQPIPKFIVDQSAIRSSEGLTSNGPNLGRELHWMRFSPSLESFLFLPRGALIAFRPLFAFFSCSPQSTTWRAARVLRLPRQSRQAVAMVVLRSCCPRSCRRCLPARAPALRRRRVATRSAMFWNRPWLWLTPTSRLRRRASLVCSKLTGLGLRC